MKSFGRTAHSHAHGAQHFSWAAELIELAVLFLAVGGAHLFVSLMGHHADGATMLIISGAALTVGAVVHRWWGARSRWTTVTERRTTVRDQSPPASTVRDLLELPGEDRRMWQVRATLRDRPGSLAALSGKLAALDVNILAIQVHPTEHGAADELLVAVPRGVTIKEIVAAVDAGGGVGIAIAAADTHDLVDPSTRALDLAVRAASDNRLLPGALAELLRAAVVCESTHSDSSYVGDETMRILDHAGAPVTLTRPGLPFTAAERARAEALVTVCTRLGPRTVAPC